MEMCDFLMKIERLSVPFRCLGVEWTRVEAQEEVGKLEISATRVYQATQEERPATPVQTLSDLNDAVARDVRALKCFSSYFIIFILFHLNSSYFFALRTRNRSSRRVLAIIVQVWTSPETYGPL